MITFRLFLIAAASCTTLIACSENRAPAPATIVHAPPSAAQPVTPYVLENTEVRRIESKLLGRSYDVLISLPESYKTKPDHRFPVLFVTDANYALPLLRSIAARVGDHGAGLEEFVLMGLGYAKGDTPAYSRRRDYTPTVPSDSDATSDMPGRVPAFGQAGAYKKFIAEEVFPLIADHYRVDMKRKTFAGHSYGALLGTEILLTEPTMFKHYIISSPSLWFDHKVMFAKEANYAKTHKDMVADVFMMVGAFENNDPDMVAQMQSFHRQLEARHYPGLRIQSEVLVGEDHLTGNPKSFTRGLLWALSPKP